MHYSIDSQNEQDVDDPSPDPTIEDSSISTFIAVKEELRNVIPSTSYSTQEAMQIVIKNGKKLGTVSSEELFYRRKQYKIMGAVLRKRLHCTICDVHIGCHWELKKDDIEHPLLKVLACAKCTFTYKYIDFPLTSEGKDVRCRWCTKPSSQESPLRFCQYCPFAFCEMCIYCNLPLDELARNKGTWRCFVCNMNELWPSRAALWALLAQIQFNKSRCLDDRWKGDVSTCCKTERKKNALVIPVDVEVVENGSSLPAMIDVRSTAPRSYQNKSRGGGTSQKFSHYTKPVKIEASKLITQTTTSGLNKTKPLPASKFETFWLKGRVEAISMTLQTLNANLNRVSNGVPEIDDKFNIKSKMISLTSLLNIGANQISTCTRELESDWEKVLDAKSVKTHGRSLIRESDIRYPVELPYEQTDQYYLDQYNIQPCFVKLSAVDNTENSINLIN